MADLALKDHLARAGAFAKLVEKHKDDLAAIANDAVKDVPKAISIGQEFHEFFTQENVKQPGTATQQSGSILAPQPPAAAAAVSSAPDHSVATSAPLTPKQSAQRAAVHFEQHGLSPAEQAIFDRASQGSG